MSEFFYPSTFEIGIMLDKIRKEASNKSWDYIRYPQVLLRDINRFYHVLKSESGYNDSGIDVFERDWDNLLLLDGCRYDMFEELSELTGQLEQVESRASMTLEWLESNCADKDLRDTVYITANPMHYKNQDNLNIKFHDVVKVWESNWNEKEGTVLPEDVVNAAIKAEKTFPNKRLLIHFLQPHYPFLNSDLEFGSQTFSNNSDFDPWYDMLIGQTEINTEQIRESYYQNLRFILPKIDQLMKSLSGKTVVTSDHGNFVGERSYPIPHREYGHPPSLYRPELVIVPWLVQENTERKEIMVEDGRIENKKDQDVEDKLAALGYV